MDKRSVKFAQLLAIANVLGERVSGKKVVDGKLVGIEEVGISGMHLTDMQRKPARTLERIHHDLMEHADKFGKHEMILLDMFGEIMADMSVEEFTNEPLDKNYLHPYYIQQNALAQVTTVKGYALKSGLNIRTVQRMCVDGSLKAKNEYGVWLIETPDEEEGKEE